MTPSSITAAEHALIVVHRGSRGERLGPQDTVLYAMMAERMEEIEEELRTAAKARRASNLSTEDRELLRTLRCLMPAEVHTRGRGAGR